MAVTPNGFEPASRPAERRAQFDLNRRLSELVEADTTHSSQITSLATAIDLLPRGEIARATRTTNQTSAVNFFVAGLSINATCHPGRKYEVTVHLGGLAFAAAPVVGGRWDFSVRADATDLSRVATLYAWSTAPGAHVGHGSGFFQLAGGILIPTNVAFSVLGTLTAGAVGVNVNATTAVPSWLSVKDIGKV